MSISERERQTLESIGNGLTRSAPKLASMLTIFTRLTVGEKMPARKPVRRVFGLAARPPAPGRPRRLRLGGRARRWLWLAAAVAMLALTVILSLGTGARSCPNSRTASCGQGPVQPGAARPGWPSPGESGGPPSGTGGPPASEAGEPPAGG